jgi:hypothetical protein
MSTYRRPVVNNERPQMADLGFFCDVRFDADDSAPTYIGLHVTNGAATDAEDWKVLKFSYSGSNVTRVQTAYGSWDGRAGLF